jgi:hypothetical protein
MKRQPILSAPAASMYSGFDSRVKARRAEPRGVVARSAARGTRGKRAPRLPPLCWAGRSGNGVGRRTLPRVRRASCELDLAFVGIGGPDHLVGGYVQVAGIERGGPAGLRRSLKRELVSIENAVTGIGSFSSGPTQPVTFLSACFNEALPVMVPSGVEIVTRQFPVTSTGEATTGGRSQHQRTQQSQSVHQHPRPRLVRRRQAKVQKRGFLKRSPRPPAPPRFEVVFRQPEKPQERRRGA